MRVLFSARSCARSVLITGMFAFVPMAEAAVSGAFARYLASSEFAQAAWTVLGPAPAVVCSQVVLRPRELVQYEEPVVEPAGGAPSRGTWFMRFELEGCGHTVDTSALFGVRADGSVAVRRWPQP